MRGALRDLELKRLVALAVSMAFPMAGMTLLAVMVLDMLVISRIPVLKRAFS